MTELGIKCSACKNITETVEPITIQRSAINKYNLSGTCIICKKLKSKALNKLQRKSLPPEILNMQVGTTFTNNIEKEGGIFPIIPLIGAIAAGISALTGVAGVTASSILKAKENSEQARHNKALEEEIAKGSGIETNKENIDEDELFGKSVQYIYGKGFKIFI
jgi:hypothetical protein